MKRLRAHFREIGNHGIAPAIAHSLVGAGLDVIPGRCSRRLYEPDSILTYDGTIGSNSFEHSARVTRSVRLTHTLSLALANRCRFE